MNSLQFTLNRHIFQQHSISKEIDQFMLQNNVAESNRFKIITCTLEAIANVFTHANPPLNHMIVILHCDKDKVTVDLLDNSKPSDFETEVQCPPARSISGRGLWILNNWMDTVRTQKTVAGTHLQLTLAV